MHEAFQGQQFYHGTSVENADGILASGAKPNPGRWGKGFYVTPSLIHATSYATAGSSWDQPLPENPAVLSGSVEAKNPKIFHTEDEVTDYLKKHGVDDPHDVSGVAHMVGSEGHDYFQVNGVQPFGVALHEGAFQPTGLMEPNTDNFLNAHDAPWTDLT